MIRSRRARLPRSTLAILFGALFSTLAAPALAQTVPPANPAGRDAGEKPAFAWKILVPSPVPLGPGGSIPVVISASAPIKDVRLKAQQLSEKFSGQPGPEFDLRKDGAAAGSTPAGAEGEVATFHLIPRGSLYVTPGYALLGGEFTGSIVIACDGKPEGEEVKLQVEVTSWLAWFCGAVILGVGVYVGTFLAPILPKSPAEGGGKAPSLRQRIAAVWRDRAPDLQDADDATQVIVRIVETDSGRPNQATIGRQWLVKASVPRAPDAATPLIAAPNRFGLHLSGDQARFLVNATSIAIGVNTLVLANNFGTGKDFLSCLLWGLGAPLGSKAIASLVTLATR